MYLQLYDYIQYYDKNEKSLKQILTKSWDVLMGIQFMFHKMNWLLGFWKFVKVETMKTKKNIDLQGHFSKFPVSL